MYKYQITPTFFQNIEVKETVYFKFIYDNDKRFSNQTRTLNPY